MKSLIHIGNENISGDLQKSLLAILNTSAGDDVKNAAINALAKAYQITGISISNCNLEGK